MAAPMKGVSEHCWSVVLLSIHWAKLSLNEMQQQRKRGVIQTVNAKKD